MAAAQRPGWQHARGNWSGGFGAHSAWVHAVAQQASPSPCKLLSCQLPHIGSFVLCHNIAAVSKSQQKDARQ